MAPDYDNAVAECIRELRELADAADDQAARLRAIADGLDSARHEVEAAELVAVLSTVDEAQAQLAARGILAEHKRQHAIGIWYRWLVSLRGVRGLVDVAWSVVERVWAQRSQHERLPDDKP